MWQRHGTAGVWASWSNLQQAWPHGAQGDSWGPLREEGDTPLSPEHIILGNGDRESQRRCRDLNTCWEGTHPHSTPIPEPHSPAL